MFHISVIPKHIKPTFYGSKMSEKGKTSQKEACVSGLKSFQKYFIGR